MNLFDMLRRKDPNLVVEGTVVMAKETRGETTWRGLNMKPGSSFRIPDARRFVTFRDFADTIGWHVDAPSGSSLRLSVVRHGTDEILGTATFEGGFQPLTIPWPKAVPGQVDVVAECIGSTPRRLPRWLRRKRRRHVFVAAHRALSREWLLELCMGNGIEIGPGPQPQVLPGEGRAVSYLEQMPAEEWNRLYNRSGKFPVRTELWGNYIAGDAFDLPVADGSLDFIFASHVFEHLANPLGHLEQWSRKLAPGGKLVCVVPDLHGTKDAVQDRSTFQEWREEFEAGLREPTERHYCRHLRREPGHKQVIAAMARRESIHVHFYDHINCSILLRHAVRELGYADFAIEHTPNHKDFHFVLEKR